MYTPTEVAFWMIVIGGLGLFIFGISSLSKTLRKIAGPKLKKIISKCSNNSFVGLLVGAGFTTIIQSSSATSALTISLVRAGVMTLLQACAIIIGANIGTTITAFIISIPLGEYLPVFVFIGAFILLLTTRKKWQNLGNLLFALGAIFFGLWLMEIMLSSMASSSQEWLSGIFTFLNAYPWLGLLVGIVVTTCLQSSSAVIGILQGIYAASLYATTGDVTVTLFGMLPIIFGANIGTTSTAIIAAIGGSKESKRVAFFHVVYNVLGALIFMVILYCAQSWLKSSNTWYYLNDLGDKIWYVPPKIQLALCHLVFNVGTAIIFFPLIKPLCKLVQIIIPGKDKKGPNIAIKELDSRIIKSFPGEGIEIAKEQTLCMFNYASLIFETIEEYLSKPSTEDVIYVHQIEEALDRIERQLSEYLLLADKGSLSESESVTFSRLLRATKDIERIGDYGENLIEYYEKIYEKKNKITGIIKEGINHANKMSIEIINKTINAFKNENKDEGIIVIQKRREENANIDTYISKYFDYIEKHTSTVKPSYLDHIFVEVMNSYQRVYSHCSNIAKLFGTDKVYDFENDEDNNNAYQIF